MAEVSRRSFDLKSWQGLTEVLKCARESSLSPTEYASFRNLVLGYAQQKGTDAELKKRIDGIIASFDVPHQQTVETKSVLAAPIAPTLSTERHGRRVVPSFMPTFEDAPSQSSTENEAQKQEPEPEPIPPPPPRPPQAVVPEVVEEAPEPIALVPVATPIEPAPLPAALKVESTLKSIEEHRSRVMEIKRRVNALVGNPISLSDHGNPIGREYMSALLNALKATSPGTTLNAGEAMEALEASFAKILEHTAGVTSAPSVPESAEMPVPEVAQKEESPQLEPAPLVEPTHHHEVQAVPEAESEPEQKSEPEREPTPEPEEPVDSSPHSPDTPQIPQPETVHVASEEAPALPAEHDERSDDPRWTEAGGDADLASQIRTLREELKQREAEVAPPAPESKPKRSLIPSLVELEEEPLSKTRVEGTVWDPHARPLRDELSPEALTTRPTSTMTGITLETPQSELVSPEVTMALMELLHEWKIFSSSGLFGMGPGGIEHPLYIQLARLPMGAVLAGRYDDADMKVVRVIKDYVDAWRHEQGVAYNPAETFEHYLRRVSQRILRRQKGIV